jgi:uncharacterized protein
VTPHGLVGMVHLAAMPGDPAVALPGDRGGDARFREVERFALADAEALAHGGVDAILVENFGSLPLSKDPLPPHQVAFLALVARACRERFAPLPVGINCLRNDAEAAVGIAAAAGLDFVRVNVHVGAYVTDQGVIEGRADRTLRYRAALGATAVAILADVLVKHAAPLAPLDPARAARDTLERGLADALVVSGEATGAPVSPSLLGVVRAAAGEAPVFIGSGLDTRSAEALAPLVEGAIVGTSLKRGGDVRAPVEEARVRELADALRGRFRAGLARASRG